MKKFMPLLAFFPLFFGHIGYANEENIYMYEEELNDYETKNYSYKTNYVEQEIYIPLPSSLKNVHHMSLGLNLYTYDDSKRVNKKNYPKLAFHKKIS